MDELFHVSERKSTIGTELRAGLTTFLAMAYIIAVNPAVLSGAGIDAGALACATCLGAGIMTICMGIFANRPLACASGLGVNAMIAGITTTVCGGDWHVAMSVIFLEGIVILLLVLCGLREAIMDAIPVVLRHAISVGLGLFIAMVGLCDAGIITAGAGTLVGLGVITSPTFIVGIISILVTVALACRNVPGSLLIGIVVAVIAGIPLGVTQAPTGIIAPLDFSSIGGPIADAGGVPAIVKVLTDPALLVISFSLLMSDFFDTMGTAMAVAKQGEFLTDDGNVENIKEILIVDSAAAAVGGFMGVRRRRRWPHGPHLRHHRRAVHSRRVLLPHRHHRFQRRHLRCSGLRRLPHDERGLRDRLVRRVAGFPGVHDCRRRALHLLHLCRHWPGLYRLRDRRAL